MEARGATGDLRGDREARTPRWVLGLLSLVLVAFTIGTFVGLGTPGLDGRAGPKSRSLQSSGRCSSRAMSS